MCIKPIRHQDKFIIYNKKTQEVVDNILTKTAHEAKEIFEDEMDSEWSILKSEWGCQKHDLPINLN